MSNVKFPMSNQIQSSKSKKFDIQSFVIDLTFGIRILKFNPKYYV